MRAQMSSFDVARIVAELQPYIGARARKSYQPHWEQVVLRLNPKEESQVDLVIVRGKRCYLARRDRPMPRNPTSFAMLLRKHLMNARLTGATQHGFDRILILAFETKDNSLSLVVEMFRDGNVLLLDGDGVIIQPLTSVEYALRTLKRGEQYVPPPAQFDPRSLGGDELAEILAGSEADLVSTLASRTNLSGTYAEAVCAAAGLENTSVAAEVGVAGVRALVEALGDLGDELASGSGGVAVLSKEPESDDEEAVASAIEEHCSEVLPFALPSHEGAILREFPTLSAAVDAWKGSHDAAALARRQEEKAGQVHEGRRPMDVADQLGRRATQQSQAVERFHAKAEVQQTLGKEIRDNWAHVEELLEQIRQAVEAHGWDEVRRQARDIEWIESLDPVKKSIMVYLPDADGDPGSRVELDLDSSVHQNAQRYFDKGRKQKEKAVGAAKALEVTESEALRVEKKRAKDEAAGRLQGAKRSKRFWFERHRWAVVGDGHLLIGGKDARGNDQIVRKRMDRHDRYLHADLHGAPSCTLKLKDGFEPDLQHVGDLPDGVSALRLTQTMEWDDFSEEALEQAAQMAVVWSRGWSAGGAAANAFWVEPPQVSKTAETGEALARGAFVVRGTRNYLRNLPLELTLGLALVNGVPLPLTGPHSAVTAHCSRWARIGPGTTKKETLANRIAKATGLAQDDVLAVLPPGNVQVLEDNGVLG